MIRLRPWFRTQILVLLSLLPALGQMTTRVILNGGPYTDSSGFLWSTDTQCSGPPVYTSTAAISGTVDQQLFQTGRYGTQTLGCTYSATNNAFYYVNLNFSNTQGELLGQNLFNIYINNILYLSNFDVTAGPGGCTINTPCNVNLAVSRTFGPLPVTNSSINLVISQVSGKVILSSLSLIPITPGMQTIATGVTALSTGAIAPGPPCATTTTSAAGVLTTDVISISPSTNINLKTGFIPSTSGGLTLTWYPTTGNVNFVYCNWTSGSITPQATNINWYVARSTN